MTVEVFVQDEGHHLSALEYHSADLTWNEMVTKFDIRQ